MILGYQLRGLLSIAHSFHQIRLIPPPPTNYGNRTSRETEQASFLEVPRRESGHPLSCIFFFVSFSVFRFLSPCLFLCLFFLALIFLVLFPLLALLFPFSFHSFLPPISPLPGKAISLQVEGKGGGKSPAQLRIHIFLRPPCGIDSPTVISKHTICARSSLG